MEIEYENTRADCIEYLRYFYKNQLNGKLWAFILLGLVVVYSIASPEHFKWYTIVTSTVGYVAFVYGLTYAGPLRWAIWKLNKMVFNNSGYLEKKKLTITDEGLKAESPVKNTIFEWSKVKMITSTERFISVQFFDRKFILIPVMYFSSAADANAFAEQLQIRSIRAKLQKGQTYIRSRPPYALGLLCLIPLIGAFAGIVLIIVGLVRYKNKWFVLMGIGGILFTVTIYGTLIYQTEFGEMGNKSFTYFAQIQLNQAMKDVEFYKLQNGVYPDSLGQMDKEKNGSSYYDPIQSRMGSKTKAPNFYYQKAGDKYYLFSSGLDGIPGTKDDIYPTLAIKDSSKVGLLHH